MPVQASWAVGWDPEIILHSQDIVPVALRILGAAKAERETELKHSAQRQTCFTLGQSKSRSDCKGAGEKSAGHCHVGAPALHGSPTTPQNCGPWWSLSPLAL